MNSYRICQDGQEKSPYTLEQLRSMWSLGPLTTDSFYWKEGMSDWEPIERLGLDLAIRPISSPVPSAPVHLERLPTHHFQHAGNVATKAHGSGVVAIGSMMCFAGAIFLAIGATGDGQVRGSGGAM